MVIQGCGFEFCEFKSIDVRETLAWLIGIFSNHIPFSTPVPKSPAVLENFSLIKSARNPRMGQPCGSNDDSVLPYFNTTALA